MTLVGYYVHHRGAGHRIRASVVGHELRRRGNRVVALGSGGCATRPSSAWIDLPPDDDGTQWRSPDADRMLHWSPVGHAGYMRRMSSIAGWISVARPDVFVVDVSVEVTALVRLLGVPVVVIAQPGLRGDDAHRLAYRLADAILAPWPETSTPCEVLAEYSSKLVHTGGISRLTQRRRPTAAPAPGPPVLLGGAAGLEEVTSDAIDRLLPGTAPISLGGSDWHDDVDEILGRAPFFVGHTGQNAVADAAALAKPLIMLPQKRPHGEQLALAAELDRLELAVFAPDEVSDSTAWARSLCLATQRAQNWQMWETDGAPSRAADLVEAVARGLQIQVLTADTAADQSESR